MKQIYLTPLDRIEIARIKTFPPLTKKALAEKAGISRQTYFNLLNANRKGRPAPRDTVRALAKVLGLNMEDLYSLEVKEEE